MLSMKGYQSMNEYAETIERQMQAARDAQGRKGQKAKNKPSRLVLEMMFGEQVSQVHVLVAILLNSTRHRFNHSGVMQ